jgi:hypothetical protein
LHDPGLARRARELVDISLDGCDRLGGAVAGQDLQTAREFFDRFTRRGRVPADELELPAVATAA